MSTTFGPGPIEGVDGPFPVPPVYGLLAAAFAPAAGVRIVVDTESGPVDLRDMIDLGIDGVRVERAVMPTEAGRERWLNGVSVYPYPSDPGATWDGCGFSTTTTEKGFGDEMPNPEFAPFVAYVAETCPSYRVPDQDEYMARAVAALGAVESGIVANELLTGAQEPLNPNLAHSADTFPLNNAVTSPVNALATLEGAIAATRKLGLVHMTPMMATMLRAQLAIDDRTGVIRTVNGNVVIADNGYVDGATPPGHTAPSATQEWMYATGPLDIRRSNIFVTPERVDEALDRGVGATNHRVNRITYRAERYYVIDWDTTFQAAVLADRCQTTC